MAAEIAIRNSNIEFYDRNTPLYVSFFFWCRSFINVSIYEGQRRGGKRFKAEEITQYAFYFKTWTHQEQA